MFRSVAAALALLLVRLTVQAQASVHRVAPGETLWAIAGQHYGAPWRWQEIHEANRDVVEDPHRIYPGEELVIPTLTSDLATPPAPTDAHRVVQGETLGDRRAALRGSVEMAGDPRSEPGGRGGSSLDLSR